MSLFINVHVLTITNAWNQQMQFGGRSSHSWVNAVGF